MSGIDTIEYTAGFAARDRHALLTTPGIGPKVVGRLEQAGIHSLQQLRRAGPDQVTAAVCALVGTSAWANRRRAIRRALELACGEGFARGPSASD